MRRAITVGLLLGSCLVKPAEGKTLEDVLKEKGVITEEDYQAVTKSTPISYKAGKGFTFTSADEKFQLSLGGRAQVRYTYTDTDSARGLDNHRWEIRRMKMWLNGYAYMKDLTYLLQLDFVQGGSSRIIDHAYLNYRLRDEVQLLVGQTKVPFGRQWLTSSGSQQFVERSTASDMFRPGYDTGVKLWGEFLQGMATYDLGVYGGAGQSTLRSASTDYAFAARATVNPFGKMPYSEVDLDTSEKPLLSVGANYYTNGLKSSATTVGGTTTTSFESNNVTLAGNSGWLGRGVGKFGSQKVDFDTYGFDAALKWMGLYAIGEYFAGNAEGQTNGVTLHADGFYVQAGYCIIPKTFEAALRYSYVDPRRDVVDDHQTDVGGALSWYFNKHNLKVQGDVTNSHIQRATGPTDDMIYRIQAQIIF